MNIWIKTILKNRMVRIFGSSALFIKVFNIVCWLFGILMRKHWLLLRTDSSKRHKRPQVKRLTKRKLLENCISTQKNSDMETIKFYTLDEVKDKHIGKVGTPHRDKYEAELQSFLIGEAIKKARKSQNMTQEELAQKIGVQRAQVSKIESGRNLTLSTVARVFRAMGMEASLSIAGFGSITL